MMLDPGTRLGFYEISACIGKGGMGEVYRATDTRLQREVAIKVSGERFADRFAAEARLIAALNHPNICTLHDVGPNFLVMELVDGLTLADRITEGPIPLTEALAIADQIQLALAAAHTRGIIHRDLKPANIKIKPDGSVKVLDFGLAKLGNPGDVQERDLSPTMSVGATHDGVVLGTASYMAPEQARGKAVDKRADIWAFGVVLYEMVTGRRPFAGESVTDTIAAVIERDVDLTAAPQRVRPLLHVCLQKDPRRRLQDIADVKVLLDLPADVPPDASGVTRRVKRAAMLTSAASILLAAALIVLAWVHFREPSVPLPELARFQILTPTLPSGLEFYMSVSPDGKRLAYTASGTDGNRRIWVRETATLESRMLAGTEGARSLFWSPDSRFIAFGERNHLKKVEASGTAPPVTLSEIEGTVGIGSWNGGNEIIFGGRGPGQGGIRRVSASGGPPSIVTHVGTQQQAHSYPVFLPDGRHFIYLVLSTDTNVRGIYSGSLDAAPDAQPPTRLLAAQFGASYIPSGSDRGHLLFQRESTVMAQPFDPNRIILSGEPVPVAEHVGAAGSGGYFTSNANTLFYRAGGGGGRLLTWFDRKGSATSTVGTGAYNEVNLSPDGTRVATSQANGQNDLWVSDLSSGANARLTFSANVDRNPVWSPNGKQIVFSSGSSGSEGLFIRSADGSGDADPLLKLAAAAPLDWSPDGRYILYRVNDPKVGADDIWVLPMEGERKPYPFVATMFDENQAQFSPDGRWIAYRSNQSGDSEIYVREFAAVETTAAVAKGQWMVSNGAAGQPRWRSDGREIIYVTSTGGVMSVDVVSTTSTRFATSVPKTLFNVPNFGPIPGSRWDMTDDGKKFLMSVMGTDSGAAPIIIVQNWPRLLK